MTAEDLMRVCLDLDQQCLTSRPSPWGDAAVLVSRLCHAAEGQIGQPGKDLGDWRSVDLSPVMQGVGPGSDQSTVTLIVQLDEARMHRDRLAEACEVVLDRLDYLRNLWGDEAITHNVADRLREALRSTEPGHDP